MALFRYRALDAAGQAADGVMEEDSARRVVAALQQRGLTVNCVERAEPKRALFPRKPKLTWDDLHQFNEHLHAVTRTGNAFVPALAAIENDIGKPRMKKTLADVRRHVEAGNSLSEAFERHPDSFSPVYTSLVRAGERTGNLSAVFSCLATYSKRMVDLRNSIQETMVYPAMVVLVSVCIVSFILTDVVPVFAEIFAGFGGSLPAPTQLLVDASVLFQERRWVVLAAFVFLVACCVWTIRAMIQGKSNGHLIDKVKSLIPGYGRAYVMVSTERFSRALGLLLQSRVPATEALELAGHAAGNSVISRAASDAVTRVAGGTGLADALRATGCFTNSFCWLLGTAESRGEVDTALLVLADDLGYGTAHLQRQLKYIISPLLIIGLAFTVGFIVVSLYLPIFSLGDLINR